MKNIVILGGSYGGVSTAHRILKQSAKTGPVKITLVSPNTHLYWNLASPRGVIPGQFSDDNLFQPIAAGFSQYSASQFEFIVGTAEHVDFEAKTVEVSTGGDKTKTIYYDFLILATGSRTKEVTPFKGLGSTDATKNALHAFQAQVKKAKTIVVAGAGIVGVEVAGELAFEYKQQKKIILIASGSTVLEESPASVSKTAMKDLRNLKVDVKVNAKVTNSTKTANGQQELTFSSGEKLTTDMYIPAFGVIPNSSYIPEKFLDSNGFVRVDEYLRVQGARTAWAIGDVSNAEPCKFMLCDKQSDYLAKMMVLILNNKTALPYKPATSPMMVTLIGKKVGTGHYGNMRFPSFLVVKIRKTLFTENMKPMVTGSLF